MDDVGELFSVMGIENVVSVLFAVKERQIGNYYPEICNYFTFQLNDDQVSLPPPYFTFNTQ